MVFVEGDDYRTLRRPGDDPAQFRSVVRPVRVPPAPDSLLHQYKAENFNANTNVWPDSVGTADMSTTGAVEDSLNQEPGVFSDGVDDFGQADNPEQVPQNAEFAIALTFQSTDTSDFGHWFGSFASTQRFRMIDINGNGRPTLDIIDSNDNQRAVQLGTNVNDGNVNLLVINSDTAAPSTEFYLNDMENAAPKNVRTNKPFDNSAYNNGRDMGFFGLNLKGSPDLRKSLTVGLFEFNGALYTEEERKNLKLRRPEIK
jgi:hypothetical protein